MYPDNGCSDELLSGRFLSLATYLGKKLQGPGLRSGCSEARKRLTSQDMTQLAFPNFGKLSTASIFEIQERVNS
jgi:hypothetical protein